MLDISFRPRDCTWQTTLANDFLKLLISFLVEYFIFHRMLIRMLNVFPFGYVNIQNVSAKSFGIPGYRVVPKKITVA